VFALGVVESDTQDLAGFAGALEDGADSRILASIDGWGLVLCFHSR